MTNLKPIALLLICSAQASSGCTTFEASIGSPDTPSYGHIETSAPWFFWAQDANAGLSLSYQALALEAIINKAVTGANTR